jgi:Membrane domain of glycerophosphoryl diester phosphodiesterase
MAFAQTQRFLVGNVISQTFAAFFTRILPFSGFALIGFIPTMIFTLGYFYLAAETPGLGVSPAPSDPADMFNSEEFAALPWIWISVATIALFVASIATTAIWLAATSYGTFQFMRGLPVRFWECLQRGVAVVLPCIGTTCVFFLGALLIVAVIISPTFMFAMLSDPDEPYSWATGFLWLFPAIIILFVVMAFLFVRLWTTVPAIAVERPGVFAAIGRSWSLSRGHGWRLFGILLVVWLATTAASFVVGIAIVVLAVFGGTTGMLIGQGLNLIVSMIINALFAIAAAVAYVELRRAKEGFGIEDIAAVFD